MVLLFAMCCCKYITCTLDAVQCVVARGLWNVVVAGESNSMVASVLILYLLHLDILYPFVEFLYWGSWWWLELQVEHVHMLLHVQVTSTCVLARGL